MELAKDVGLSNEITNYTYLSKADIGTVTTQKVGGINTKVIQINSYDQLPPQFHRKGISQVEMDAINVCNFIFYLLRILTMYFIVRRSKSLLIHVQYYNK